METKHWITLLIAVLVLAIVIVVVIIVIKNNQSPKAGSNDHINVDHSYSNQNLLRFPTNTDHQIADKVYESNRVSRITTVDQDNQTKKAGSSYVLKKKSNASTYRQVLGRKVGN